MVPVGGESTQALYLSRKQVTLTTTLDPLVERLTRPPPLQSPRKKVSYRQSRLPGETENSRVTWSPLQKQRLLFGVGLIEFVFLLNTEYINLSGHSHLPLLTTRSLYELYLTFLDRRGR